jgi:hypothetical protein
VRRWRGGGDSGCREGFEISRIASGGDAGDGGVDAARKRLAALRTQAGTSRVGHGFKASNERMQPCSRVGVQAQWSLLLLLLLWQWSWVDKAVRILYEAPWTQRRMGALESD